MAQPLASTPYHFGERGVGDDGLDQFLLRPPRAEAPLWEYSPIESDSAKVLALHDGGIEHNAARADRSAAT
jgi:hypothetical protein